MGFKKRTREQREKFAQGILDKVIENDDFELIPTDTVQSNLPPNLAEDTDYEPLIILSAADYPWLETHVEAHYIRTTEPGEEISPGIKLYAYPLHEWLKLEEEE